MCHRNIRQTQMTYMYQRKKWKYPNPSVSSDGIKKENLFENWKASRLSIFVYILNPPLPMRLDFQSAFCVFILRMLCERNDEFSNRICKYLFHIFFLLLHNPKLFVNTKQISVNYMLCVERGKFCIHLPFIWVNLLHFDWIVRHDAHLVR